MIGRPKTLSAPVTVAVRVSAEKVKRIDAYAAAVSARIGYGAFISRSGAVRALIEIGLDAWDQERARKP